MTVETAVSKAPQPQACARLIPGDWRPCVKISVIVPVLNEAALLGTTLRQIPRTEEVEVIVVDGGSTDRSVQVAEAAGARVFRTAGGRANQMNAGAAVAQGDILLFLHADTRLPVDFARAVRETLSRPQVILGAFRLAIDSTRWSLRVIEALANFRSRCLWMPYGDQALFLRKHHFRTAAGFAKLPIMEDFEFVRRIARWGRVAIARSAVVTSARRWEKLGTLRATLINQAMILAYLMGVAPTRLARWYRGARELGRNKPKEVPRRLGWLRSIRLPWRGGGKPQPHALRKSWQLMKRTCILIMLIFIILLVAGGGWFFTHPERRLIQFEAPSASADALPFSYEPYEAVLAKYVDERGTVDYRALKANSADLEAFAASLARVRPDEFDSWSDAQKIAFWINAYNALTLEAIIRHYPIESSFIRSLVYPKNSIRQIPGVWDKLRFVVLGREMTLDKIEHGTLRTKFNEPRIHVALVCAALSCPPLRNEPYSADKLDEQLGDQARAFLHSPRGFRVSRREGKVYLSSIFKWFGQDFVKTYGTPDGFAGRSDAERAVLSFVSRYVSEADRDFLLRGGYEIEYLDYDWSLNEQAAP